MRIRMRDERRLAKDMAYGAIGGLVGTMAMPLVTNRLYEIESEEKRRREESLRTEPPFQVLAGRLVELVGLAPTADRKRRVGMLVHWGYGAAWGALYGLARNRAPVLKKGFGLPFAVIFTLVGDEAMNTLMGLTAPPKAFPIDAHVRGLAGHVAFTAATDGSYRALRATFG